MTVWVVLLCCSLLGPSFLALRMARNAHVSVVGYIASLTIGLILGIGSAASMAKIHSKLIRRGDGLYGSTPTAALLGTFLIEAMWVVVTGIITGWAESTLLRAFF